MAALGKFGDDTSASISGVPGRKQVPGLSSVPMALQVVRTNPVGLAYLMCQVIKSQDKMLIMRAIASAVCSIFEEDTNFTGSSQAVEQLSDIPDLTDTNANERVVTNFKGAEECTLADISPLLACDSDEIAAWFGLTFYAGTKRLTTSNRTAFNEKRVNAVSSVIIGDPVIFVPSSPYLDDHILQKINASFTAMGTIRAHMILKLADRMGTVTLGPRTAFSIMFLLLEDSGTGALRIIKEAIQRYDWIRTDFPELKPDLAAAEHAQRIIRTVPEAHRAFAKPIYGNAFVPAAQADIRGLLGVCKNVLARTTTTYARFGGGVLTEQQQAHIDEKLSTMVVTPLETEQS